MNTFIKSFLRDNFIQQEEIIDATRKRIKFIDLAKGVCILLVVIYHTEVINCHNIPGESFENALVFRFVRTLF